MTKVIKIEGEPEIGYWRLVDKNMLQMFNGEIWVTVSTNAKFKNRKSGEPYTVQDVVSDSTSGREGQRTVMYYHSQTHQKQAMEEKEFYEKFEPIRD